MTEAIELSDVTYRWRPGLAPVLDIPAFKVTAGERVFISGPSGSGKTTLLNLLGGIAVPETGDVNVLGSRLDGLSRSMRDGFRADHIGLIFQLFNLVPYLSLIENVLLPCRFSARRRARTAMEGGDPVSEAHRLLVHMGLPESALASQKVTDLSVGQQQRVAAARALIGTPEIIIADEPTSALDEDARQSFLDVLFETTERSRQTLIFVSHDRRMKSLFDRHVELSDINRVAAAPSADQPSAMPVAE